MSVFLKLGGSASGGPGRLPGACSRSEGRRVRAAGPREGNARLCCNRRPCAESQLQLFHVFELANRTSNSG